MARTNGAKDKKPRKKTATKKPNKLTISRKESNGYNSLKIKRVKNA